MADGDDDVYMLRPFNRSQSIIRSLSQDGTQKTIKIQQHGNELLNGLYRIHQKGNFSDVILIVNGKRIRAHRIILASVSPYFEALFTHKMQENEIELQNVNLDMLEKIINFAYSGEIKFKDNDVQELLETANFFDVRLVCEECAKYIVLQIDSQNFNDIFCLGVSIGEKIMISTALNYLIDNFVMLSKTDEFKEVNLQFMKDVLRNEKLKFVEANKVPTVYNQEEAIVNTVLSYINHKKDVRLKHLFSLLECTRIGLLLPSVLTKLKENDIVKESEESVKLIDEAILAGPCFNNSTETHLWRKPRNDSLVEVLFQGFANAGDIFRSGDGEEHCSLDIDRGFASIYSTIRKMKIWLREWEEKMVWGGFEVEYSSGTVSKYGQQDFNPGEYHEFTLDEDEVITRIQVNSGWLIDHINFFTNKDRNFGPYGGDGGRSHTIPKRVDSMHGYFCYMKAREVKTHGSFAIFDLSFLWAKQKENNQNREQDYIAENHNQFYFTDESDNEQEEESDFVDEDVNEENSLTESDNDEFDAI